MSERSLIDGPASDVYTVQKYDTLYSVAWRYELDVVDLAARNGIKPPYVIKTGQRIALKGSGPPPPAPPPAKPSSTPGPEVTDGPVEPGDAVSTAKPAPALVPVPAKPPVPVPENSRCLSPIMRRYPSRTSRHHRRPHGPCRRNQPIPRPPNPPSADSTPAATAPPNVPATVTAGGWRRPVAAKPVRGFGGGSKGLDYSLRKGTLIQAATAGVVVYAGPGLGGFRHLVIVKASERHLVAYGVNVQPDLKEGDTVRRGDTVARAGSGATGGQFHFEVRDRGKPIDPSSFIGD